jgi:hypothetical protein
MSISLNITVFSDMVNEDKLNSIFISKKYLKTHQRHQYVVYKLLVESNFPKIAIFTRRN